MWPFIATITISRVFFLTSWTYSFVAYVCVATLMYLFEKLKDIMPNAFEVVVKNKILFYSLPEEDPRLDRKLLNEEGKTLFFLCGSGDNALDSLMENPKKVIVGDVNEAQLAWIELKLAVFRCSTYEVLEQLFVHTDGKAFEREYPKLRKHMMPSSQQWWDSKDASFFNDFYFRGMAGNGWWWARILLTWIPGFAWLQNPPEKLRAGYIASRTLFTEVLRLCHQSGLVQMVAWFIGGTEAIADEDAYHNNYKNHVQFADTILLDTDITENYIIIPTWFGTYNKKALPRWLRKENWETYVERVNRVELKCGWLVELFRQMPPSSVDRFQLMDHLDWLTEAQILDEWQQIQRVGKEDGLVCWKSGVKLRHPLPLSALPLEELDTIRDHWLIHWYPALPGIHVTKIDKSFSFVRDQPENTPTFFSDLQNFWYMFAAPFLKPKESNSQSAEQAKAMDDFYRNQADIYDLFRDRMLHARPHLMNAMPFTRGCTWVDVGAGTGFNLEYVKTMVDNGFFKQIYLVDICKPLLDRARRRIKENGWERYVTVIQADASAGPLIPDKYLKAAGVDKVDFATFSYSLCMIPEWESALNLALDMVREDGFIGAADFTVTDKQWSATRLFWSKWFSLDGVHLTSRHIQTLTAKTKPMLNHAFSAGFPYFGWAKCWHFAYIGKKCQGDMDAIIHGSTSSLPGLSDTNSNSE